MRRETRRRFIAQAGAAGTVLLCPWPRKGDAAEPRAIPERLKAGWALPPRSYRPHTRWWWPGSAVTKEGIGWELDQMRAQGMGGVEIMSSWRWYEKGNLPYLSEEWADMVRYAIRKAGELDMEVALTFGAGWSFGGTWVPIEHRSKVLAPAWQDVNGPVIFDAELPHYQQPGREAKHDWVAPDEDKVLAAVAGRIHGNQLDRDSLVDLAPRVENGRLKWSVPEGQWRIMAFRIKYTYQVNQAQSELQTPWVVDHLNKAAMQHYAEYLASAFQKYFGDYLGKVVDSFFCDSFEIRTLPNTLLWSTDTLDRFKVYKGYDLAPWLPAIWFDIGELTPKIRYDVNEFLHWLGLETCFRSFIDAAAARHVQARIQPHYRFTEELIQGAGITPRPETEVTTARFEPVADPRKATSAGAHFYGREIVSAEAYTFIHHPVRYRTSLQELKIATDAFLRDGVTQFYNCGYTYSPEMQVAPQRDMPWASRISHWNPWWKYYHHLAAYISRAAFLLRQGVFAGDVLLYSPQSTVWTGRVVFGTDRRVMPYGNLAKTLVANGYDFDPVNDDILQNHARIEGGQIQVRDLFFRFLVLPKILALPLTTLKFIHAFVRGGGVVIAVDELPSASVGFEGYREQDEPVRQIVTEMFGADRKGRQFPGGGRTYFFPDYKIVEPEFSPAEKPYTPTPTLTPPQTTFLDALRRRLAPDFALADNRQSDGLTFLHRKNGEVDVYFVTNLQPKASKVPVTFRVTGKRPDRWDPMTGGIDPVHCFRTMATGTEIPLELEPWESTFIVFSPASAGVHLTETNLAEVTDVAENRVTGFVTANGPVSVTLPRGAQSVTGKIDVTDVPQPSAIFGAWKLTLAGVRFPKRELRIEKLSSWTEDAAIRNFSGTGIYEIDFDLPQEYLREDLELALDMGSVGDVAEVVLNGRNVGVTWMPPYKLTVTGAARAGKNSLKILVTNQLINQVAGMKTLPEMPVELEPHYGKTVDIYSSGMTAFKSEQNFEPLPASGLLGPVRIMPRRKETIALPNK